MKKNSRKDLLRELPRLQMRFQNRANFEAMLMHTCDPRDQPDDYLSSVQLYGED